eukprot:2369516-Rhodomonas_salina.1
MATINDTVSQAVRIGWWTRVFGGCVICGAPLEHPLHAGLKSLVRRSDVDAILFKYGLLHELEGGHLIDTYLLTIMDNANETLVSRLKLNVSGMWSSEQSLQLSRRTLEAKKRVVPVCKECNGVMTRAQSEALVVYHSLLQPLWFANHHIPYTDLRGCAVKSQNSNAKALEAIFTFFKLLPPKPSEMGKQVETSNVPMHSTSPPQRAEAVAQAEQNTGNERTETAGVSAAPENANDKILHILRQLSDKGKAKFPAKVQNTLNNSPFIDEKGTNYSVHGFSDGKIRLRNEATQAFLDPLSPKKAYKKLFRSDRDAITQKKTAATSSLVGESGLDDAADDSDILSVDNDAEFDSWLGEHTNPQWENDGLQQDVSLLAGGLAGSDSASAPTTPSSVATPPQLSQESKDDDSEIDLTDTAGYDDLGETMTGESSERIAAQQRKVNEYTGNMQWYLKDSEDIWMDFALIKIMSHLMQWGVTQNSRHRAVAIFWAARYMWDAFTPAEHKQELPFEM